MFGLALSLSPWEDHAWARLLVDERRRMRDVWRSVALAKVPAKHPGESPQQTYRRLGSQPTPATLHRHVS